MPAGIELLALAAKVIEVILAVSGAAVVLSVSGEARVGILAKRVGVVSSV